MDRLIFLTFNGLAFGAVYAAVGYQTSSAAPAPSTSTSAMVKPAGVLVKYGFDAEQPLVPDRAAVEVGDGQRDVCDGRKIRHGHSPDYAGTKPRGRQVHARRGIRYRSILRSGRCPHADDTGGVSASLGLTVRSVGRNTRTLRARVLTVERQPCGQVDRCPLRGCHRVR